MIASEIERVKTCLSRSSKWIDDLKAFVLLSSLTRTTFITTLNHTNAASQQERQIPVDHRKAANPYKYKYGCKWNKYIEKSHFQQLSDDY